MRAQFIKKLKEVNNNLLEMGAEVENSITMAAKALITQDVLLAKQAIDADQSINQREREIESLCLKLILRQQPIAKDLRNISAALKMIADMERIGDQASNISEITLLLADKIYVGDLDYIPKMSEATVKMVKDSVDAYVAKDLELAHRVIAYDDVVDAMFVSAKQNLIQHIYDNRENGEQVIDLLMAAKYFERIGDHAVNIAEWVAFAITGKHKNNPVF